MRISDWSSDVCSSDLTIQSVDTGAAAGPSVIADRASPSPAALDFISEFVLRGRNSAGEPIDYASFVAQILDVTDGSEDALVQIMTYLAGTKAAPLKIGAGIFTPHATGEIGRASGRERGGQ